MDKICWCMLLPLCLNNGNVCHFGHAPLLVTFQLFLFPIQIFLLIFPHIYILQCNYSHLPEYLPTPKQLFLFTKMFTYSKSKYSHFPMLKCLNTWYMWHLIIAFHYLLFRNNLVKSPYITIILDWKEYYLKSHIPSFVHLIFVSVH